MEVMTLNAALKLIDEVSPTVGNIEQSLSSLEKALGVTRAEVEKNRQAMAEATKVGQMMEYAWQKLGITAEEYNQVLYKQAQAMDAMQKEALETNAALDAQAAATAKAKEMGVGFQVMLGTLAAQYIPQVVGQVKGFIAESTGLAIKLEMLEKATRFLGQQQGLSAGQVDELAASLNKQGITLTQSRENLLKMTQAGLDMNKATALARVAQDAGRIQNINSSDAMDRLVRGIVTMQTETLRGLGINVNAAEATRKYEKELGIAKGTASQAEKTQAMYNAVLEQGVKIQGVYGEMAETAGGMALSMDRKRQDALTRLGQSFLEIRGMTIQWETKMWELLTKYPDLFAKLAVAITAAGAAYAAFLAIQKWDLIVKSASAIGLLSMSFTGLTASLTASTAAAITATTTAFAPLTAAVSAFAASCMAAFTAESLMAAPLILVVAAVVAVGAAVMYTTNAIVKFFGLFDTWKTVMDLTTTGDAFQDELNAINAANFDAAINSVGIFTAALEVIPEVFRTVGRIGQEIWAAIVDIFNWATQSIGDSITGLGLLFKGMWNNLLEGPKILKWLKDAWDSIPSSVTNSINSIVQFMMQITGLKAAIAILSGIVGVFKEIYEWIGYAVKGIGGWIASFYMLEEKQAAAKGAAAYIKTASDLSVKAGQAEIKTTQEAAAWYKKKQESVMAEAKALAESTAGVAARIKTDKEMIMQQAEEARQLKLINKVKQHMSIDKRDKVTYERALEMKAVLIEMKLWKEEVSESDKEMKKAQKTAEEFAKALDNVSLAAKKGIRKEKSEINVRAGKEAGPDEGILAAQEKAIEDGEAAVEAIEKQLSDLKSKYKKGVIPPEVIQNYKEWTALVRQNAQEKAEDIGSAGMLAAFKSLGPTIAEVTKQYNDMQAAMNKKITVEGGVLALDDSAIKAYVSTMSKLQETNQLTEEQVAAMGPIFEEAYRRGIIGAEQLAVSTGKVSAETLRLQGMFGPTADQIADKFNKIQEGIIANGGISKLLETNPNAGRAAVKALDDIRGSGLATKDMLTTMGGQFALAEQQGVKSAVKITIEQIKAAQSTRMWSQGLQGLIGLFGMFGATAGAVAQTLGNTFAEFNEVGKMQTAVDAMPGKLIDLNDAAAVAGASTDDLAKSASQADKDQAKFNATINAGAAAAGLLGGMMGKSSNATMQQAGAALQGAAAGAKMGASFGPIGAAVGAAIGGITGWISAGKKMKAEVKKMYEEFEKANGGLEEMSKKAKEAGVSLEDVMKNKGTKNVEKMKKAIEEATAKMDAFDDLLQSVGAKDMAGLKAAANEAGVSLQKLFDAKSVEEYKAAAKQVKEEMALWGEAQDALTGAMDKYGITVDQLGGKFKQAGFDKMGVALLKDFEILKAAGVDVSVITEKMSEDMSDYVNRAVAAGTTIPLAMKPMVQQMIDTGNLLDENGKAIGSMEESGISFAQTLEEGIQSAVTAIEKLVEVLSKGFNIPVEVNGKPANGAGAGSGGGSGSGTGSGGGGGGGGGNNTAADHRATKNAVDEVAGAVGNLHDQYASAGEAAKAAAKDAMDVVKAEHGGAIKAIVAGSTAAKDAQKTWATESVSTFKTVADSASTAYKTAFDAAKNGGASLRDAMKAGTDAAVTASQDFANSNLAAAQSSVAAYGSAAEAGKAAFKASIDAAKAAGEKIGLMSKEGLENYTEAKNAAAAAAAAWTGAQESIAAQAIVTSAAITVPIEAGAAVATDAAAVMAEQSTASFIEIQDATLALADSMSQDVPAAADIAYTAIQRIRDAAAEPIDVNVTGGGEVPSFAGGSGGFRDFGRGTPAMLHGVEAVVRPGDVIEKDKGGSISTVVNLAISENPMQTAETVEQMRAFTLETVQREISRSLADAIEAGRA